MKFHAELRAGISLAIVPRPNAAVFDLDREFRDGFVGGGLTDPARSLGWLSWVQSTQPTKAEAIVFGSA